MIVLAVLAGLVTMALLFKPLFGDLEGLQEALGYCLKPDFLSWIQGEWGEDFWAELRVSIWIGSGVLVGLAVYSGLEKLLG